MKTGLFVLCLMCCGLPLSALEVVVTTTQLKDMVSRVGGDRVRVRGLMGPSVDPHMYKPTASDVNWLQRADVIFYNGLYLEGKTTDVLRAVARRGKRVVAVGESLPQEVLIQTGSDSWDPHIWLNPRLWGECVAAVEAALIDLDGEGAEGYRERANAYRKELDELFSWAQGRIAEVTPEKRVLITSHDAFGYLGRAFGIEVYGIQGISTVTEAGLADMTRIIDLIRERGIASVFVESSVSSGAVERISRETGAKIGGVLYSDAMGIPGTVLTHEGSGETYDPGTYSGMLRHNIHTIVDGLK